MQNSPARTAIDVGSVIADTYTIEALVGRGGMGAVFLASHKRLPGKKVAIKMLHAELSGDEVLARFKREAQIASLLGHPNICAVHDFNVLPDGTPYLVLDYLEGESLAQRLKAGPLSLDHAMSIVRQIGSALAAAHRAGIVHRDLKPANIFLVPTEVDGRQAELAKVLDFGISKIRGSDTVKTQDSALLGTPQYMAPEQAIGQHSAVDERTDVFALGAIVYEMLAGHPAFSGASIPEVVFKVVYEQPLPLATEVPSLPAAVAAAVNQAMSKAAGDRYSTVSAFVEALTGHALAVPTRPSTGGAAGGNAASISGSGAPVSATDATSVPPVKGTGNDAFAQTVGSGDHGESPIAAPVRGSAPTVDSMSIPPPRRSRAIVIGVVLGVAVLAAVIYLATRDRGERHHHERVAAIQPAPVVAPAPTPPQPIAPPPVKAIPRPVAAAPVKHAPAAGPTAAPIAAPPKPEPHPIADESTGGDETNGQKLKEAEAALSAKDYGRAEQLANAVITGEQAGRGQKAHAHVIHGIVECASRNSDEHAQIDLRQLAEFPKLHKRLVMACHAEGQLAGFSD